MFVLNTLLLGEKLAEFVLPVVNPQIHPIVNEMFVHESTVEHELDYRLNVHRVLGERLLLLISGQPPMALRADRQGDPGMIGRYVLPEAGC